MSFLLQIFHKEITIKLITIILAALDTILCTILSSGIL